LVVFDGDVSRAKKISSAVSMAAAAIFGECRNYRDGIIQYFLLQGQALAADCFVFGGGEYYPPK